VSANAFRLLLAVLLVGFVLLIIVVLILTNTLQAGEALVT
jgi:hypothetical protein